MGPDDAGLHAIFNTTTGRSAEWLKDMDAPTTTSGNIAPKEGASEPLSPQHVQQLRDADEQDEFVARLFSGKFHLND